MLFKVMKLIGEAMLIKPSQRFFDRIAIRNTVNRNSHDEWCLDTAQQFVNAYLAQGLFIYLFHNHSTVQAVTAIFRR